jgi:sphinganine C4-monooxygenase
LFGNNVAYHDIHHQHYGIKKNFSQPYFTHWDVLLNTRMTAEQVPERQRERYHAGPIKQLADKIAKQQLFTADAKKEQ